MTNIINGNFGKTEGREQTLNELHRVAFENLNLASQLYYESGLDQEHLVMLNRSRFILNSIGQLMTEEK